METGLIRNPKVIRMGLLAKVHPATICGAVFVLWALADEHTTDGRLEGYTFEVIDAMVGVTGFCAAAQTVDWIGVDGGVVYIPRFDEHNGQSAKQRALTTSRVAKHRSCNAPSVTESLHQRYTSVTRARAEKAKSKQRKDKDIAPDIACPDFHATDDACSLLRRCGLNDGAVQHLLGLPGVDECKARWAVTRLVAELEKARTMKRPTKVRNPVAYVRRLLERGSVPQEWRDDWNRKRLAESAAKIAPRGESGGIRGNPGASGGIQTVQATTGNTGLAGVVGRNGSATKSATMPQEDSGVRR